MFRLDTKVARTAMILLGLAVLAPAAVRAEGAEKEESIAIPNTLKEIWAEVKDAHKKLDHMVKEKQLGEVHKTAFAIRDYVNAMAAKSGDLTSAKLATLNAKAKAVANLAKLLDEAGDSGDQAMTGKLSAKLHQDLKKIEALYPKGALTSSGKMTGDSKMPGMDKK
jgi:DNA topoisomerase VI subunit B